MFDVSKKHTTQRSKSLNILEHPFIYKVFNGQKTGKKKKKKLTEL